MFILQAFCLPIIQIVHETLRDVKEGKGRKGGGGSGAIKPSARWKMNVQDRTDAMGELCVELNDLYPHVSVPCCKNSNFTDVFVHEKSSP